jgi:hypothetical protein
MASGLDTSRWNYYGCLDVNECIEETHNCNVHATCVNTPTGFECYCATGYFGDGFSCFVASCGALEIDHSNQNGTVTGVTGDTHSFMCQPGFSVHHDEAVCTGNGSSAFWAYPACTRDVDDAWLLIISLTLPVLLSLGVCCVLFSFHRDLTGESKKIHGIEDVFQPKCALTVLLLIVHLVDLISIWLFVVDLSSVLSLSPDSNSIAVVWVISFLAGVLDSGSSLACVLCLWLSISFDGKKGKSWDVFATTFVCSSAFSDLLELIAFFWVDYSDLQVSFEVLLGNLLASLGCFFVAIGEGIYLALHTSPPSPASSV